MGNLTVTNFVGTGTITYTLATGGTTVTTGTFTSTGTNILLGYPLISTVGSTYDLTLTASATITYTIVGTKALDYGDSATTLVFTNNILTIDNVISLNDTDVIDFVLPAGYNIPDLNVTNFVGTGNVSYTLTTGGNTVVSGSFSATSTNILTSGFSIFSVGADTTYTLSMTADATIAYTIVGTSAITNISSFSITQLLGGGYTEQNMIDAGKWNADSNANRFDQTYINGFLDISGGNVTVNDNILMDSGDAEINSMTFTQPYTYDVDLSLNSRLFVVGDVSMGDASLNIAGDLSLNGIMSVGSYKPASISTAAVSLYGYSTAGPFTTFTEDIAYNRKIEFNGDISLNLHHVQDWIEPNVFTSTDAKTSTPQIWYDIEISSTGLYQIAVAYGGNVWISSNYGKTWTETVVGSSVQAWRFAMISGDGSTMMARADAQLLWKSTDYGTTWTSMTWNAAESATYYGAATPMILAYDGNRMCSAIMTNTNTTLPTYSLTLSTDGGETWTTVSSTNGRIDTLSMSKSGQYIVIIYGDNATKPKYSDDYGVTFITLTNGAIYNYPSNMRGYNSKSTISNTGKLWHRYWMDAGLTPTAVLYGIDVNTGTVTNGENNATLTQFSMTPYAAGEGHSLNSSNDGKYILYTGYQQWGQPRLQVMYYSNDYGGSFTT